jgi:rRNA processing protein Gar1
MKQKLGTVYTITPGKLITVRLGNIRKPPRLGLKVYSNKPGAPIGRLIDVIGPVESPFAVVKLEAGASVSIGEPLYIEPPVKRGQKNRQKRGRKRSKQKQRHINKTGKPRREMRNKRRT